MVTFAELQNRLIEHVRFRVRNGELTERGLARLVGVSQPHMHNVLKGVRTISPELGDQILVHLRISLIDLLKQGEVGSYSGVETPEHYESCYIPVLRDPIGPGFAWPKQIDHSRRFLIDRAKVAGYFHPIVGRIAHDARMLPAIQQGDFALLDQTRQSRERLDPTALYLIKSGPQALIRRVRMGSGNVLYLATEDAIQTPSVWQKVTLTDKNVSQVVRARVHLVAPEREDWWESEAVQQKSA